jgi:ribonucleoside-diphosphate reductase alpha chain
MSLDSPDWASIQYQNANNSVRVTDEFMRAVLEDEEWNLTCTDGSVVARCAPDLMHRSRRRPGSAPIPACTTTPP